MEPVPGSAPPRLVLFDVGNVLIALRPWREVIPFVNAGIERGDVTTAGAVRSFHEGEVSRRFELGRASVEQFLAALRAAFPSSLPDVEILGSYRRVLGEEIAGMKALLLDLKRRGVRVAGLSDTNPVHLEALSGYAVVRELELLLASCITGRAKPHLDTFQHALAALGVAADEVFFTDDLEVNVEGARRAGIRAEVFRGVEDLRRTLGV